MEAHKAWMLCLNNDVGGLVGSCDGHIGRIGFKTPVGRLQTTEQKL